MTSPPLQASDDVNENHSMRGQGRIIKRVVEALRTDSAAPLDNPQYRQRTGMNSRESMSEDELPDPPALDLYCKWWEVNLVCGQLFRRGVYSKGLPDPLELGGHVIQNLLVFHASL